MSKALVGDYREEHLFTLRQSLARYRFLEQQIADCDREIARRTKELAGFAEEGTTVPPAAKRLQARKGVSASWLESQRQEYFRLFGVDLTQIASAHHDNTNPHRGRAAQSIALGSGPYRRWRPR